MTTGNYPEESTAAPTGGAAGSSSAGAKEQAKQAAGTAAEEGKQVAGVAQGEAKKVASEAMSQAHGLLDQTTSQLEDQGRTQRDRLVETLRSLGDDLEKMASSGDGTMASNLAREVADRTRSLSSQLDGREPRELLDDVRTFARRKPGVFLAGALVAGVVAGRFARGAKDAQSSGPASPSAPRGEEPLLVASTRNHGTTTGEPIPEVGLPHDEPLPRSSVEGRL